MSFSQQRKRRKTRHHYKQSKTCATNRRRPTIYKSLDQAYRCYRCKRFIFIYTLMTFHRKWVAEVMFTCSQTHTHSFHLAPKAPQWKDINLIVPTTMELVITSVSGPGSKSCFTAATSHSRFSPQNVLWVLNCDTENWLSCLYCVRAVCILVSCLLKNIWYCKRWLLVDTVRLLLWHSITGRVWLRVVERQ